MHGVFPGIACRYPVPPPLLPLLLRVMDFGGLWRIVAAGAPPPFLLMCHGVILLWRNFEGYPRAGSCTGAFLEKGQLSPRRRNGAEDDGQW